MQIKFKWEKIIGGAESLTDRARVLGGWLVRTSDFDNDTGCVTACSMVFIPDPDHYWSV